ncbi:MAG: hypothetical protein KGJ79_15115 [Alphaproteobacteria bacterium]|nr:hypothetical protein [Alphaproteobacteria bacterium]MDE2493994.1 hypothetical protein [Alphaproteobacteria bacterium]
MPHQTNVVKITILGSLLALGALATAQSASADDDGRCGGVYCHVVCDRDGDHCYRTEARGDDWHHGHDYYSDHNWDHGRDWDRGYHHMRYVCDTDGDRCYRSGSDYWNYREYYRIHGYHWAD